MALFYTSARIEGHIMAKDDVQQVQDVEATDAHAEVVETDWKAQARNGKSALKRTAQQQTSSPSSKNRR